MYLEQFNTGISQLYQKKCTYVTGKNPKCFLIIENEKEGFDYGGGGGVTQKK